MSDKFQHKYRIPSARLHTWDYHCSGAYFITICTQNRKFYFGEIQNCEMQLSEIGRIVEQEWLKTFDMRPDMNLQMGAFVVMPNHFHAIIIIGENEYNQNNDKHGNQFRNEFTPAMEHEHTHAMQHRSTDAMHCVSSAKNATTPITPNRESKNQFGAQSKNLASIIRGFKIGVTTNARKIDPNFEWQTRFYDHIIRNEKSFERIQTYINENPIKWGGDKFYNKE